MSGYALNYQSFLDGARDARQTGEYDQNTFFRYATDILSGDGAINDAEPAYLHNSVYSIDGYDGSSFEQDESVVLFVCDETVYRRMAVPPTTIPPISYREIMSSFSRLKKFVEDGLSGIFPPDGSVDYDAIDLAQTIRDNRSDVQRYQLYFLTDRLYTPVDSTDPKHAIDFEINNLLGGKLDGKPLSLHVWDLSRWAAAEHGEDDQRLTISTAEGIPAVKAPGDGSGFDTYLMFLKGDLLADLYEKYGSKLMESNVRSFLSFRGKVNQGIRNTIRTVPQNFVAYNNGISATATDLMFAHRPDGSEDASRIAAIADLQIVNGGQTTAAIFNCRKNDKVDLSRVVVPAKVVVVSRDKRSDPTMANFVPDIARFTNSQNKVSQTDLSSTSPYQMRLETLSRIVYVPPKKNAKYGTYWYYERARGQYAVERDRLFGEQKRQFNKKHPKSQVIKLSDAVRYMLCWEQEPDTVSLGTQKSFTKFSKQMSSLTQDDSMQNMGEDYYKDLVCAKILYDTAHKYFMSLRKDPSSWYRGYPGPVTAYAVAKISYDLAQNNQALDFDRIWKEQRLPDSLMPTINYAGAEAMSVLTASNRPTANVTEWAKSRACWRSMQRQGSCLRQSDAFIPEALSPHHGHFLQIVSQSGEGTSNLY